jgi:hypothetical protein
MVASGPVSAQAPLADAAGDPTVVVTPIPMPAQVTELSATAMRPAKKPKLVATNSVPAKSMLSRTERHQVALLAGKPKGDASLLHDLANDDEDTPGIDDLDLHRSFARPRLAKLADQDQDDEIHGLSASVKLRLLLARMKAVEVHEMVWAADAGHADEALSDTVQRRLSEARMKAVQAHRDRFA